MADRTVLYMRTEIGARVSLLSRQIMSIDPDTQTFIDRVIADGGTVADVDFVNRQILTAKSNGYYDDLVFARSPSWGIKIETGALKLYSLTGAAFDTTQPVLGLQPLIQTDDLNGKDRLLCEGTQFIGNNIMDWPAGPRTVALMGFSHHGWVNNDIIFGASGSTTLKQKGVSPALRLLSNDNDTLMNEVNAIIDGDFHLSALFNDANSSIKIDDNTETTGSIGAVQSAGYALGASPSGGDPSHCSVGAEIGLSSAVDGLYAGKMQAIKDFSAREYATNCKSACENGVWSGKKLVWVGTSIPFVGATPYPILTGDQIGANVTNEAVSSSHIGLVELDPLSTAARSLSATQAQIIAHPKYVVGEEVNSYEVKIIGSNADLLVIDHGHNDTDIPSGDINGTDIATFMGGVNVVVQVALVDNPDLDIVFLTPPKKWFSFGESSDILRIRDDIFSLAAKYNKSVIDLTTLCGFTEDNYLTYFPDDTHPNEAGRIRIANVISNNINSVIKS